MGEEQNVTSSPKVARRPVEIFDTEAKSISWSRLFWRELRADKVAMVALVTIVIIMLLSVIISAILTTEAVVEVTSAQLMTRRMPPFWQEGGRAGAWLGTDAGGRDVLQYLIIASRNSLFLGFSVAFISIIIGVVIGIISGFYGGHVDNIMMRITDTWAMIPSLMFMVALVAIMDFTMPRFIMLLVMFSWMGRARLIRSVTLQQRNLDYVHASKTLGTSNIVIIFREIMPNLVSIISANVVLTMAGSIGIEVGLALLGYGLPAGTPSLGAFVAAATTLSNLQNRWWMWAPGIVLMFIMILCINFVGQAISRIADPKQRRV